MLIFWTIFGLFKPRHVPLKRAFLLGFSDAVNTLFSLLVIQNTSLSVYQASRLAVSPVTFLFERVSFRSFAQFLGYPRVSNRFPNIHQSSATLDNLRMAYTMSIAIFSFSLVVVHESLIPVTLSTMLLIASSIIFAAGSRIAQLPALQETHVTELQLQLYTKICALPFLTLTMFLTDSYHPRSEESIWRYPFPEHFTILIFFTGLLAFLSFISMRASSSRSTVHFFILQSVVISICTFGMDWLLVMTAGPDPMHPSSLWFVSTAVLSGMTGIFGFIRDAQLVEDFQREVYDVSSRGLNALEAMESAEIRSQRHREELREQLLSQQ